MNEATQNVDLEATLRDAARLIKETVGLAYDPSQEAWVCSQHGISECWLDDCPSLAWPEPNDDPVLASFTDWADRELLRVVRAYDESGDSSRVMPDEAFHAYPVWEWPVGALLGHHTPAPTGPEEG